MKLGIIGVGKMGGAILQAIVEEEFLPSNDIFIFDVDKGLMDKYIESLNVNGLNSEIQLCEKSDLILFAIKPQYIDSVLEKIKNGLSSEQINEKLWISIAAGVKISQYQHFLGEKIKFIRIMPNLLVSIKQSASAICGSEGVSENDMKIVVEMFEKMGSVEIVSEKLMDVVTGLSGSGPAFVTIFIESLADGAVLMGLPRDKALKLAAQTVAGTGAYVLKTGIHPAVMKDAVSSPGGTTITGLNSLEKNNFRYATMSAIEQATKKSIELGKNKEK